MKLEIWLLVIFWLLYLVSWLFGPMNLANITTIKHLCKQHHIRPQRQQGQNFLIDKKVLGKLIQSAELQPTDTILEVGPGFGVITCELVKHVKKVIAVELDKNLIPILRENTRGSKNLTIIPGDILKLNLKEYGIQNNEYRIVSNLPYSITSRFIRNALSQNPKPTDMTLITQRQVADRICAKPGGNMSLLSVSVQFFAQPKIIDYIKPESFWPSPEVESAIIKIDNIKTPIDVNEKEFFRVAKIGFSARRKMLKNNLASGLKIGLPPDLSPEASVKGEASAKGGDSEIQKILESIGLNPTARAQDLSVEDWIRLADNF